MADQLTFYTHPMSRGRIVRWMLEEVGQPYETVLLDYASSMKASDYLAINPMGKVPAIKHGDVVVTECAAICTYLADAFPDKGLSPLPGSPERGAFYRWMFFAAGPVETAALVKAVNAEVPADRQAMAGYGTHATVADVLEKLVTQNDYVLGNRFSAVDVYLGSQIGWGTQFGTIEKRAGFDAYLARIMSRPAALRAREIDDKAMAA
ncbi:glutathione S-transferase family protein [Sphingomonas tabacisoli]|uniref:Glutathione S-transferase family protein n=1 Tax=Sphingomonas tabacisoli TaxID=2249466 RepID=A0ABW4HZ83_9SPHN